MAMAGPLGGADEFDALPREPRRHISIKRSEALDSVPTTPESKVDNKRSVRSPRLGGVE